VQLVEVEAHGCHHAEQADRNGDVGGGIGARCRAVAAEEHENAGAGGQRQQSQQLEAQLVDGPVVVAQFRVHGQDGGPVALFVSHDTSQTRSVHCRPPTKRALPAGGVGSTARRRRSVGDLADGGTAVSPINDKRHRRERAAGVGVRRWRFPPPPSVRQVRLQS
jgi:hypothetical protein